MDTQIVKIDTIVGPKDVVAPKGWAFNTTDVRVWSTLLDLTAKRRGKLKTVRERHVLDGQIYVLANILANSLGMASFYWESTALDLVRKGKA